MFRLNRLTDYGVVVLSQISLESGALCSAQHIARHTGVPLPTVAKVLNILQREHLVDSHRGAAGGYTLSRPANEIKVSEVIEALEGPIALTACVENAEGHCEVESLCPMRGSWDRVNRAIRDALERVSLAEMVGAQGGGLFTLAEEAAAAAGERPAAPAGTAQ